MKYNSIGEQLIAKAKELDPNYKPDKFNDMSEAIDILLNNSGGSDDFIDLVINVDQFESWVNLDTWNLTMPANTITTDMLLSITQDGKKGILLKITMPHPDEEGQEIFCAIIPFYCDFLTGALFTNVTNIFGKIGCWIGSVDEVGQDQVFKFHTTAGNKIWYDLDTMSGTITQNQYDEIKALVDTNSLAGLAFKTLSTYCPLANIFDGGIFVFRGIGLGLESTGGDRKNAIDESTITIKSDLSVTYSLEEIFFPVLTQNLSSQSIISVKTDGYQENLSIGDGLEIKGGALDVNRNGVFKTNTVTISKSEISLSEAENKQINFNTTAQEKITNLFTLINQNQNNIVSIKSIIKLIDGSSFIIYMDYHAVSAINSENIQGIAISSAINNSFDLHLVFHDRWQSSADLTNFFSNIQEYEIVFCYF